MATLVFLHAHPDDEAVSTSGTMARARDEGHRVVLVVATDGDFGEVPDDLGPAETLVDRRRRETRESADALGVARVVWMGYRDSGMTGWEQNAHPDAFIRIPVEVAAARLAEVLEEERADVLVTYDWHGNYGHPDHIQVHRVGHRAAELAGTAAVFEVTMNRDHFVRMIEASGGLGSPRDADEAFDPNGPADDGNPFGMPEGEITHGVDVTAYLDRKRASLQAHRSQMTDTSFFLEMPDEAFAGGFGTEWFIERRGPGALAHAEVRTGPLATWLLP